MAPYSLHRRSCFVHTPLPTRRNREGTNVSQSRHRLRVTASPPAPEFTRESIRAHHPWKDWVTFDIDSGEDTASPQVVRRLIGMGTWNMKGMMVPEYDFMESELEGLWRQILEDDLALLPFNRRYKLLDSMDPTGEKGEAYTRQSDNPKTTDREYPRLIMENRMYCTSKFRRMHMGVGARQDGLQFVHCSMIPDPKYDIPMFSATAIGLKRISLCHVDLYPVNKDGRLHELYSEGMRLLQHDSIESNMQPLEWTAGISSERNITFSPKSEKDSIRFLSYTALLGKLYMKTAEIMQPVESEEEIEEIKAVQERFCVEHRKHTQLESAISRSFGKHWTAEYLNNCYFPSAQPN